MKNVEDGYGSIFVRVFVEDNSLIIDPVTEFIYVHTDKADDDCRIIIETDDFSIVDNKFLQEGKVLNLLWGYLRNPAQQKRKDYIWDSELNFL